MLELVGTVIKKRKVKVTQFNRIKLSTDRTILINGVVLAAELKMLYRAENIRAVFVNIRFSLFNIIRFIKLSGIGCAACHSAYFGRPVLEDIAVIVLKCLCRGFAVVGRRCAVGHILVCFQNSIAVLPNHGVFV